MQGEQLQVVHTTTHKVMAFEKSEGFVDQTWTFRLPPIGADAGIRVGVHHALDGTVLGEQSTSSKARGSR